MLKLIARDISTASQCKKACPLQYQWLMAGSRSQGFNHAQGSPFASMTYGVRMKSVSGFAWFGCFPEIAGATGGRWWAHGDWT
jgi:hypothetical protein